MRKKLLSIALCATMVAGIFTGCGSSSDTSKKDEGKSADGKITLNVINYHVGTDYAADYYEYLFDAFKKTEEGKNVEFKFEEIPTTDAYNQKIKLLISSGDLPDIVLQNTLIRILNGKQCSVTRILNSTHMKERFTVFRYQKKFHIFTTTKTYLRKQDLKLLT